MTSVAALPPLASPGIFPPAAAPRFLSIQVLRAVAALGVIYQHIQYDFQVKFGIAGFPPRLGVTDLGVDLFFVISGFIMVYTSERLFAQPGGWKIFITRRLIRIVPIYWATSLAALAYILLRQRGSDMEPLSQFVRWIAASFMFLPYPRTSGDVVPLNGVGWTLNYEMYFYAIFALAIALPRRLAVAAISLLFAAIALAGLLLAPLPNPLAFWADTIILEFVFGMLIALALREGLRLPSWLGWGCVIAGLAAYVWVGRYGLGDMPRVVYWGLPSALIIAGLAGMARPAEDRPPNAVTRFFAFLGDASYSIYLLHPFMLTAPRLLMFGLAGDGVSPPAQPWLYAGLQFAAAVLAGVALHLLFERPVTRWLRARSEGPRASGVSA